MSRVRGRREDAVGVRTPLLASASAALAVAAHGVAGGSVSDALFSVLLATLLAWGGMSLARRGGVVALVGVLGVTQLCQHVLLTELASRHEDVHATFDGRTMFAAHVVATLLTAVLLRRAGAAIAVIGAAVGWLLGRLTALVAGPVPQAAPTTGSPFPARPGVLLEVLLRQVRCRRGPPLHS